MEGKSNKVLKPVLVASEDIHEPQQADKVVTGSASNLVNLPTSVVPQITEKGKCIQKCSKQNYLWISFESKYNFSNS
jgi:hypothetical protein